ncbi:MAG: carbamoyltransferase [Candidatus Eisenbacteria bacterium]|uniref:Carbamoyltransferase n=1 Tax=Eiseniibacteriota bacterium TaxID=2212470 RepID=A0A956SDN5_UNCEI|nr:carbamoyltransferase [Candidatus Eisenbacteria bacterium]MCB9463735.1 carbamoyltransferase [Candidatus Eisenbacteria bacterium]
MNILGISAFYHDSAACLIQDGEIVAAAQEERFTRKKHDFGFPSHAAEYCLGAGGIQTDDLDLVAFYDKPLLKFDRLLETYFAYAPRGFTSFLQAMPIWTRQKLFLADLIKKGLDYHGKIIYPEHHESHAASAFFPSPFEEAAFLTTDGVGEWTTTSYGVGKGNRVEILGDIQFPHSLGMLYSAFTYYTGFRVNSGEYKVMGLAPYGEPKYVDTILEHLMDVKEDGSFRLDMKYFDYCTGMKMTNGEFDRLFGGPARKPESQLTQREMDLAASVQIVTEIVMMKMARHVRKVTGQRNLCLAGGVALNCVANGKILREEIFDDIWIQPAAGDAGGALGCALSAWHHYLENPRIPFPKGGPTPAGTRRAVGVGAEAAPSSSAGVPTAASSGGRTTPHDRQRGSYLGPEFSDAQIQQFLDQVGAKYERLGDDEVIERTADILAAENVVGWFQGRMEFGPRALGNRSIIGDSRSRTMQTTMNLKIKFRESFRPFAPSVLEESISDWFEIDRPSPYMLLVADVKEDHRLPLPAGTETLFGIDKLKVVRSTVPSITHVDYSARIQSVSKDTNPRYHALISAFHERTGCPVIVNTSFNVRGEPIVCSPKDAYTCFMRTDMDYLVLGNYVLAKPDQPPLRDDIDWKTEFQLD